MAVKPLFFSHLQFLGLQVLSAAIAIMAFKFLASRDLAANIAGIQFVALGAYIVWRSWQWEKPWQQPVLYGAGAHLFLGAIPLLGSRWIFGAGVAQWQFFAGMNFHQWSERIFSVMVVTTLLGLVLQIRIKK